MKVNTKVYIAGPISGTENFKEKFEQAEEHLKEQGLITLNPAMLPAGLTQEEYMSICIPMLRMCGTIYMLEGWEKSVGAKIEHSLAVQAEKTVIYQR